MANGSVVSIHIAPAAAAPMVALERVHAEAGRGLRGDRYYHRTGAHSRRRNSREVTLIEQEALDACCSTHQITLAPGVTRRNIVTQGIPLNALVGREFYVGRVRMRGMRLCVPCQHLVHVSGIPALLPGLIQRGGLHAVILQSGEIVVGDTVSVVP